MTASEIKEVSETEPGCQRLMTISGIGPLISTAMVAAIGKGEAYDRGRDFTAWLGLVPRQYSTGGSSHHDAAQKLAQVQLWRLVGGSLNAYAAQQTWRRISQQTGPDRMECPEFRQGL